MSGGVMEEVIQKALDMLEEAEGVAFESLLPKAVRKASEKLGVELRAEDIEALGLKVLEEGKRRQREVLQELWRALEISLPPWVEERLRDEKRWDPVSVWFSEERRGKRVYVKFFWDNDTLSFPLRRNCCSGEFAFVAWPGGVAVKTVHGLRARRGRVYWKTTTPEAAERILQEVGLFAPVFARLNLADLEVPLLALGELEDGQVRAEGAYVLAREGATRVLFRGSLFGDPHLDGAFLLGQEVALFHPEGVKVRLKGKVEAASFTAYIDSLQGSVEYKGEKLRFAGGWNTPHLLESGPHVFEGEVIPTLLRNGLRAWLEENPTCSPWVRALIEELSESPLQALKRENLLADVYLRLLSWY
jgi:hypothetical protein